MIPLAIGALVGGGIGGMKFFGDKMREGKDRELAAATQKYSPWTGLQAGPIKRADLIGSIAAGGAMGASAGQSYEAAQSSNKLNDAMADYYQRGGTNGAANQASFGAGSSWSNLAGRGQPSYADQLGQYGAPRSSSVYGF